MALTTGSLHRLAGIGPGSVLVAAALLALSSASAHADPSFDCSRARAPDEIAICADPRLAKLDSLAAQAFAGFEPSYQTRQKVAELLLRDRSSCGSDKACIAAAQWNALETFGGDAPWVRDFVIPMIARKAATVADDAQAPFSAKPPSQPAQCLKTRISGISTRFGNPVGPANADEGISILYANGGDTYSYERGKEFARLAVGQPIVLCLVSTPYDCPAGDQRGIVYYALSPETGNSWVSSDAEHGCGGA